MAEAVEYLPKVEWGVEGNEGELMFPWCYVTGEWIPHIRYQGPPHDEHGVWTHPYRYLAQRHPEDERIGTQVLVMQVNDVERKSDIYRRALAALRLAADPEGGSPDG